MRLAQDTAPTPYQEGMEKAERELLLTNLRETDWNISVTAMRLGMHRSSLKKRMRAHGLKRPEAI